MNTRALFASIVGDRYVLDDEAALEVYGRDEYPRNWSRPRAVVLPATPQEACEVVSACYRENIPLTPRGRGTGLSGGAVPLDNSIVLSLERLERILEINDEDHLVVTEPGVIVKNLHDAVEAQDLYYPPDPASLESCSIGGNVAENSGGPRALKYGVTRHYLLGLDVILPGGEFCRMGGRVLKNTTGYDLPHLFVGSEGTLGVITAITLRLIPRPRVTRDLLIPFGKLDKACQAVNRILLSLGITPAVLEFMDQNSIAAAEAFTGQTFPFNQAEGHLLVQLDGSSPSAVEEQAFALGELCLDLGADDVLMASTGSMRDRLWSARRVVLEACKTTPPAAELHDISVPHSRIPALVEALRSAGDRYGVDVACFGHAGDGNVHVALMSDDPASFTAQLFQLNQEVAHIALSLDGAISGEHGIGAVKKPYLSKALSPLELKLMRSLKATVDPQGLMNPGKIF